MPHQIIIGDVLNGLATLPDESVHCCVTSPPYYGLRDYGVDGQIGLESSPEEFITRLVAVFREVRRVLRSDGTCWVNMGDSYNAHPGQRKTTDKGGAKQETNGGSNSVGSRHCDSMKPKDLMGIPWMLAFALRADGWWLRSEIIWHKPNPMPESVTDRPTKSHEQLFLLAKSDRYFYDAEAVKESSIDPESLNGRRKRNDDKFVGQAFSETRGGFSKIEDGKTYTNRNRRTVWTIATQATPDAHFATFPEALVTPCILAGTSEKGVCPACGAPWVRLVDKQERIQDGRRELRDSGRHGTSRGTRSGTIPGSNTRGYPQYNDKTTGWQPSCECDQAEPIPATVLDPFLGSGTTLAVAKKLGRNGIGCELNPEYAEIARKKIARARIGDVEKPVKPLPGQKELFADITH